MTVVQLGAIQMNNEWADPSGSKFYLDRLDGWDSPPLRTSTVNLPSQHGGVTTENLYNPRLLTLGGICKATSANNFYASMYYMMAQWNALVTPITLTVTEDIARRATVIRNGQIRTSYVGVGAFTWEVQLRADDPFKYNDTLTTSTFSGGTSLTNTGIVRTYPTVTLNATGTPVITVGPLTFTATASIPSGTVLDMKRMTALNGGTSHFDKVSLDTDWPWLEAGANAVNSNLNVTFNYRDAWV